MYYSTPPTLLQMMLSQYIGIPVYSDIYSVIVIVIIIVIMWSHFIPSRNIDEVSLITIYSSNALRSCSRVKASMVLTIADHLVIHNYIRSLLNIILRPILMVRTGLEPASYRSCVRRSSQPSHAGS